MIPKFRAWDSMNNEWAKSFFLCSEGGIFTPDYGFNKRLKRTNVYPIVRSERFILMQSTGLFDSRSEPVEIYKDDIVKRTSLVPGGKDFVGVVKMLEGCWVIENGKEAINLWTEVDENIVIGNIHEHPELVEGGG